MTPEAHKKVVFAGLLCISLVLSAVLGSLLPGAACLYAQESEIFIDNASAYSNKNRSAVYFSHENHMESFECLDCHHDYQNGKNVLDEDELEEDGKARCATCHTKGASIDLKTAYHRQCVGCHRLVNKQEDAGLPITCQNCHPRNPSIP